MPDPALRIRDLETRVQTLEEGIRQALAKANEYGPRPQPGTKVYGACAGTAFYVTEPLVSLIPEGETTELP